MRHVLAASRHAARMSKANATRVAGDATAVADSVEVVVIEEGRRNSGPRGQSGRARPPQPWPGQQCGTAATELARTRTRSARGIEHLPCRVDRGTVCPDPL